jgi:hypothetical protein
MQLASVALAGFRTQVRHGEADKRPGLIATAKLNDVEPYAYLHDVLERMVDGDPMSRIDELLPWNWKQHAKT